MKSWKIILPSLIATSGLPLVSLVSCGKTTLLLNEWNGATSCLESKFREMVTGDSFDFSINVNDWRMSRTADYYYYFAFYLDNGVGRTPFKLKEGSLTFYVDNKKLTNDEWTYRDGICLFTDAEVIQRMLDANKITGSFTVDGPEATESSLHVCFYGAWHELIMNVKQTNGEEIPESIKVDDHITVAAYYKGEIIKDALFFSELPATTIEPTENPGEFKIIGKEVGRAQIKCMAVHYEDVVFRFRVVQE